MQVLPTDQFSSVDAAIAALEAGQIDCQGYCAVYSARMSAYYVLWPADLPPPPQTNSRVTSTIAPQPGMVGSVVPPLPQMMAAPVPATQFAFTPQVETVAPQIFNFAPQAYSTTAPVVEYASPSYVPQAPMYSYAAPTPAVEYIQYAAPAYAAPPIATGYDYNLLAAQSMVAYPQQTPAPAPAVAPAAPGPAPAPAPGPEKASKKAKKASSKKKKRGMCC